MGIKLAVSLKSFQFRGEHLDPGMGHGAGCRYAVQRVGQGAGRSLDAADISRPGADDRTGDALGPAGTELHHRPAFRGPHDAVSLGGNQGLVVNGQQ